MGGLPYLLRILPKSHTIMVDFCEGHRRFSSVVTQSQAVFGLSQAVMVATLSTACIGVTNRLISNSSPSIHIASYPGPHAERGRGPGDTWQNSRMCSVSIIA